MACKILPLVQEWLDKGVDMVEQMAPIRITEPESKIKVIADEDNPDITPEHPGYVNLPEGCEMTPCRLSNGKIWLKGSKNVVTFREQFQNLARMNLVLGHKIILPEGVEVVERSRKRAEQVNKGVFNADTELSEFCFKLVTKYGQDWAEKATREENITFEKLSKNQKEKQRVVDDFGNTKKPVFGDPLFTFLGGENYFERIIKEKNIQTIQELPPGFKIGKIGAGGAWCVRSDYGSVIISGASTGEIAKQEAINYLQSVGIAGAYQSVHFLDVRGYLAHWRGSERIDANGDRGGFIEEVQSDREQESREEPIKIYETHKGEWDISSPGNRYFIMLDKSKYNKERALEEARGYFAALPNGFGTFFHPLLKIWLEIILKDVLIVAAERGWKWIAWTSGEQQVQRYDLRNWVRVVRYSKDYRNKRIEIFLDDNFSKIVTLPELQFMLGKVLAKKIIGSDNASGEFSGDDLKRGGTWAEYLYDKRIPHILKRLTKGKIKAIDLGLGYTVRPGEGSAAEDVRMTSPEAGKGTSKNKQMQQSLAITPAVKAAITGE